MGKPRRIDIDDRIPCNINGEYILSKCEDLNEIWPALFIKALLKLNIYKVRHPLYEKKEENIDISYIYALTGYHIQMLKYINLESEIENLLQNNINDDNYINKKKYILCLNFFEKKIEGNKKEKYYEEIIDIYNKIKEDNNTIKDEYDEERKFINNKKKITVINRETKLKLENAQKQISRKTLDSFSTF